MKKKFQGSTRARRQQLQALCSEFELHRMQYGETILDFFSRTMVIISKMRTFGEKIEDVVVVEKILRSLTPKFNYVVCSIEESKDLDLLSIDKLQDSLLVHEGKLVQQDNAELELKVSSDHSIKGNGGRKSNGHNDRGRGRGRNKSRGRGNYGHRQNSGNQSHERLRRYDSYQTQPADKSNVECYRCHKYGHYKSECRTTFSGAHGEESNFIGNEEEQDEDISLLMVCHAKEPTNKHLWYLDTGCINHMSGDKRIFSTLDESFRDNVKFDNNTKISVMGKGQVTILNKSNVTQTMLDVLYVPDLKTNLLSIDQLQEKGYEIKIKNGMCQVQDGKSGLIAQVAMTANRMFPLHLNHSTQSCFAASLSD
ncbi:hypothetical protein F3Y22_tig00111330pilonHSYRG00279 [Hibiscus syriacus]|uniref:CCHC-type domain-containing protein n=1 Tax=Hibiscus syriacus TaxID=106335 RepID=A0A6A2YPP1_HIBSY|nr:hypothetical protein F3Y22_tig00111330pilonHSYRG00279 [Hibiscus syriacus]